MFWYYLWHQKRSELWKSFLTFDVLFDVLIFNILINHFILNVPINLKNTFDVLILSKFFIIFLTFNILIFDVLTLSLFRDLNRNVKTLHYSFHFPNCFVYSLRYFCIFYNYQIEEKKQQEILGFNSLKKKYFLVCHIWLPLFSLFFNCNS